MSHIVDKKMKKDKGGLLMFRWVGISPWNSVGKFRGYTLVDRKKIRADIIDVEIQRVSKIRAEKLLQYPRVSHHEHSGSLSLRQRRNGPFSKNPQRIISSGP